MNNYNIAVTDIFNPEKYPKVVSEITVIKTYVSPIGCTDKSEIVISFLKDHCLKNTWLKDSRPLTDIMTSGFFKTPNIEKLFDSCKGNVPFLKSYESFIRMKLD